MKINRFFPVFLLLLIVMSLTISIGCDDDDDDDDDDAAPVDDDDDDGDDDDGDDDDSVDDDDDTGDAVEQFCEKVAECEEADTYVVDDACEASAALMANETLECALVDNCGDFVACVEGTDDGWKLDGIVLTAQDAIASPIDFDGWSFMATSKITTFEKIVMLYQYDDNNDDCDIQGGSYWVALDDEDFEKVAFISPNAPCKLTGNSYKEGPEFLGSDLGEGTYTAKVVFVDEFGQQSKVFEKTFTVEDYDGGVGDTVDQLSDATFFLPGINPPVKGAKALSDIYFDNFAGKVVLFNTSTVWCVYCGDEADEMMELYNIYNGATKAGSVEVEIVTLISEDGYGTGNVTEQDLLNWADRPDPHEDLTFPLVIDSKGTEFSDDYMMPGGGFPFNMIVDPDGVIRYKVHGFSSSFVSSYSDIFDTIIAEFETK